MQPRTESVTRTFDYNAMLNGIDDVVGGYSGNNESRLELIEMFKSVMIYLKNEAAIELDDKLKYHILLGAYTVALERIEAECWAWQGSSLRALLYKVLNIKTEADLDNQVRFIAMTDFYNYFALPYASGIKMAKTTLPHATFGIAKNILKKLNLNIAEIEHALPIETQVDADLLQMVDKYSESKILQGVKLNPVRLASAQLIEVVTLLNANTDNNVDDHRLSNDIFSATFRIKLGLIIYTISQLGSRSKLYQECVKALNIRSLDDINPDLQQQCLIAYHEYISQSKIATFLEKRAAERFEKNNLVKNLELPLRKTRAAINAQLNSLDHSLKLSVWSKTIGIIFAVAAGVVCYGMGKTLGDTVGKTDYLVRTNSRVSNPLHYPMSFVLGPNGGDLLGYYAANLVVSNTLKYGFGVATEALGVMGGFTTGALIGVLAFQITPYVVEQLLQLCVEYHPQIKDPLIAEKVDIDLIKSLLASSDILVSARQKQKISTVAGVNLFSQCRSTGVLLSAPHGTSLDQVKAIDSQNQSPAAAAALNSPLLAGSVFHAVPPVQADLRPLLPASAVDSIENNLGAKVTKPL